MRHDVISLMFTFFLLLLGVKFTVINPSNKIHIHSFFNGHQSIFSFVMDISTMICARVHSMRRNYDSEETKENERNTVRTLDERSHHDDLY